MTTNVLMFSPGFPSDVGLFTKGLAAVGARVIGIGDQPQAALAPDVAACLSAHVTVSDLWSPDAVVAAVREQLRGQSIDRVECLWEPGIEVCAALREAFDVPGMRREQATWFRDKERMKQVLDAAGVRTPKHARATTTGEVREAIERIGYPAIVKPIAGAGAADTYRVADASELDRALQLVQHVTEVSVEEFIDGDEYTFDTVCARGNVLFRNVASYRPKPLVMRQNPWISPVSISLQDLDTDEVRPGVDLGNRVLEALGFEDGFTHMEWFRTPAGEAVFGEIGARSPGGRIVHAMNLTADIDLFTGWAEAVCHGRLSQDTTKHWNVGVVFKRAEGVGRIQRVDGLESLMWRYGEHVRVVDLVPIGEPRRDYRKVVEGDGWIAVRHPNLETTVEIANAFATELRMYAG